MSTSSSVCFSACTVWTTSQVRAWVSPSCNESSSVTAAKYGPTPRLIGAPPSTSRYRRAGVNMSKQAILLVEDDEDDALLTTRALRKINLANEIVVVNDGALALDYSLRHRRLRRPRCTGAAGDRPVGFETAANKRPGGIASYA